MAMEQRVVVLVNPQVLMDRPRGVFAARILELGLTAYGSTHDEALQKVKALYAVTVQGHRKQGDLAAWLNRSGLQFRKGWDWASDYRGDTPVEDVDSQRVPGHIAAEATQRSQWHDLSLLGIAA